MRLGLQAVYIPGAQQLTNGGFYSASPGGDGYDTAESARLIMENLLKVHSETLATIEVPGRSQTLLEVSPAI